MHSSALPIRIGILHSLTGITAISELPLVQAAQMAVDEINERGGVLGRPIEVILKDGASTPETFSDRAQELLEEGVCAVFGCWSSSSRKAVKPVIEAHDQILLYPMQYEGLEQSPNIVYTGSCLNQQFEPGVKWVLDAGKRKCFMVGSDYVYPRTANALVRALMEAGGGEVLDEQYIALNSTEFARVADDISQLRSDIVFSTIAGEGNLSFFCELHRAGVSSEACPVLSFSFSEIELQSVKVQAAGHYACWSYFQSLATPENRRFIRSLHRKYGDGRVASDPMVAAYVQVHLWANTVRACGSTEPSAVLGHACGQRFMGPAGWVEILANNHVAKEAMIGRATHAGEFEIVWRSEAPIPPKPWLGAEDIAGGGNHLVLRALGQYSDAIHLNWKLAEENRKREQAEEALRHAMDAAETANREIQRREEVAEGLGGILAVLNSARPLAELLDYIIFQAKQLLGSDGGEVYRVDPASNVLSLQATTVQQAGTAGGLAMSAMQDILGQAVLGGRSLAISDMNNVSSGGPDAGVSFGGVDAGGAECPHGAMLAVPLLIKQDVWGALALFYRDPTLFTTEDVRLAELIGEHAALAVENARLREQAGASATAAERLRLGRELHDSVTQSLFAAALMAEAIPQTHPDLNSDAREQLAGVRRLTRGALAEMRSLLLELRPEALRDAWLGDLLTQLVQAAQSRCLALIDCSVVGRCALPADVHIALYRIAQEALSNVTRHSMASQASVCLQCSPGEVRLRVVDDGKGFDPQRARPGHLGLRIMRERAEAINASLDIEALTGRGTVVAIDWRDPVQVGQ